MSQRENPLAKLQFEVSLVEHCNLNCAMCDHFSPLAQKEFLLLETFEQDIHRLAELFHGEATYIYLLGGEPLLHPNLCEFIRIARCCFRDSNLTIFTNGLNICSMPNNFWRACKINNVILSLTKYPNGADYNEIIKYIQSKKIDYIYSDGDREKQMIHSPLDEDGKQDIAQNFALCYHANNCIQLKNGKLYPCTIAPNAYHFNRYFNANLQLCENDGIDIYKVNSPTLILELLNKPIRFCRYCKVKERTGHHKWKQSERTKDEW